MVGSSSTTSLENSTGRDQWGKGIEFLMSCIAMSVGLGNVWRFPFIALENGGGAFVIPYIIVLLLVGKPVYYMEMIIGQFSSRGSVKIYDCAPIMRGNFCFNETSLASFCKYCKFHPTSSKFCNSCCIKASAMGRLSR